MGFISKPEVVRGSSDGKLAFIVEGRVVLRPLLGNISEDSVAEGTGGSADGRVEGDKEVGVKLRELVLTESNGEGASGTFEPGILEAAPGKFEAPVGKGALKLGYCMEGGIESPGGGRSKDCWCKCGSPFGGP